MDPTRWLPWIFGVLMGVLSFRAVPRQPCARSDAVVVGLLVPFGLAFIFWLIAKHTGHPTGQQDH